MLLAATARVAVGQCLEERGLLLVGPAQPQQQDHEQRKTTTTSQAPSVNFMDEDEDHRPGAAPTVVLTMTLARQRPSGAWRSTEPCRPAA